MRPLRDLSLQYPQPWLRQLLVIVHLFFIAALAFRASQRQLTLILILLVGVGMVLLFLRWPPLGLIVTSLAGMFVPFTGPSGLNVTMILVALLLGLWLLDLLVHRPQVRLVPSRTVRPLLYFLLVAAISFAVGQLPWFSFAPHAPLGAQLGGLSIVVLSAATFLLMANQMRDLIWLKAITWTFLAFGVLAFFARSVLPELGLPTRTLIQPVGGVYYIWVVSLAFSQAAFNRDLRLGWRLALAGFVALTLYNLLFLRFANKSGWIPAVVCLAAIIGFRSWRAWLVLIPLTVIMTWYLTTGVVSSEEYSYSTRLDAWSIMAQIIRISPVWGLGFANYYWYTPLFPIRGYAVSFNSHNNYVDIVAQTGVIGLICFLLFLWQVGRLAWRLRDQVPAGFAQAYVYGALGGLMGTVVIGMLGDWVLPFFYNIGLSGFRSSILGWLFLGGLVSLQQMVRTNNWPETQT